MCLKKRKRIPSLPSQWHIPDFSFFVFFSNKTENAKWVFATTQPTQGAIQIRADQLFMAEKMEVATIPLCTHLCKSMLRLKSLKTSNPSRGGASSSSSSTSVCLFGSQKPTAVLGLFAVWKARRPPKTGVLTVAAPIVLYMFTSAHSWQGIFLIWPYSSHFLLFALNH